MDTFIENSFCRCCSSEGTFKDVSTKYHWMGVEEIYAEMLKECFNITLLSSEENKRGICELCITQLRNAANFKKQVLNTEDRFRKVLENKQPTEESIEFVIKSELEAQEGDVSDDNENVSDAGDPDYVSPDFEMSVKEETEEIKPQAVKRTAQPSTSRAKKSKAEQPETSKRQLGESKTGDKKKCIADSKLYSRDINKHRSNLSNILQHSNATPITRSAVSFICEFCVTKFSRPSELKGHIENTHKTAKERYSRSVGTRNTIKLDVTDLTCHLCDLRLKNLEQLTPHLQRHGIKMFTDINNTFMQCTFNNDKYVCVLCDQDFDKYLNWTKHMNSHYKNFICEECGAGFVNLKALSQHSLSHSKGEFACEYCGKILRNMKKKKVHVLNAHVRNADKFKCPCCEMRFASYTLRQKHINTEHNDQYLKFM